MTTLPAGAVAAGFQSPRPRQSFRSFFLNLLSKCRPVSELFDPNSFSRPRTPSEAYSRIRTNFPYFAANYLTAIIASAISLTLINNPSLLLRWGITSLLLPTNLCSYDIPFNYETSAAILLFLSCCLASIAHTLLSVYAVGFALVLAHSAFHHVSDTVDLFHDHHPRPNNEKSLALSSSLFFLGVWSKCRNWSELIDRNYLSRPETLSEAYSRIICNFSYFCYNYTTAILIASALFLAVADSNCFFALAFLDAILSRFSRFFIYLVFFGCATPICETIFYLTCAMYLILQVFEGGGFLGCVNGFVLALAHSMVRIPEDLFFDCQEKPNCQSDGFDNAELDNDNNNNSSSSSLPKKKHDVFISFRGHDIRDNFKSYLLEELLINEIDTYTDDRLGIGENISATLQKAIQESVIYVIVFSPDYASSPWCLDELKMILECKEKYQRDVIPIFYNVDPSTVKDQKLTYTDAFDKHEIRYKDKVKGWRGALYEAAGLPGWDSNTTRPESTLVTEIVKDIQRRLKKFLLI